MFRNFYVKLFPLTDLMIFTPFNADYFVISVASYGLSLIKIFFEETFSN